MQAKHAAWPYSQLPLLAPRPSTHPCEVLDDWLRDRCGCGPAPAKPRVWIAGCRTTRPYAFAAADPNAEVVATDLRGPG